MKKLSFKVGVLTALAGTSMVIGGVINANLMTRIGGYILATPGFVIMGKRLYERVRERAKAKALVSRIDNLDRRK